MNYKTRDVKITVSSINHPSIVHKRKHIEKQLMQLSNMGINGILYERTVNKIQKSLSELKQMNTQIQRKHIAVLATRNMKVSNKHIGFLKRNLSI
jgi:hypothetical protein